MERNRNQKFKFLKKALLTMLELPKPEKGRMVLG
jgi:hypothetical protein